MPCRWSAEAGTSPEPEGRLVGEKDASPLAGSLSVRNLSVRASEGSRSDPSRSDVSSMGCSASDICNNRSRGQQEQPHK